MTYRSNVRKALEQVEQAVARADLDLRSRQPRFGDVKPGNFFGSIYKWIKSAQDGEPEYKADTRNRDEWLSKFWRTEPHLAGVINSVVTIDKNRDWSMVGGRNQVYRYNTILRNAEDGAGWRHFFGLQSLAYYTSNAGAICETGRDGDGGPLRALYNVDSTRCRMTGNRDQPLEYHPAAGGSQDWGPTDFFRVVSLPSGREGLNGVGFCAIERCLELAKIMLAVYEHDLEVLGSKAPKGLLLLNNISQTQWDDAMTARDTSLAGLERDYYGGVAVLANEGFDSIDAKLIALSQLPAGFDLEQFTQLLMFGFALAFGYDPIEFWPVQAGALGRGRETEIQHEKATGKGGVDLVLSWQDQIQMELPETVDFQFEERDDEGDIKRATVIKTWAEAVTSLTAAGITTDEARALLAEQGIIPQEWAEIAADEAQQTSEERTVDKYLESENVRRAIVADPDQPIVRSVYNAKTGRTTVKTLWHRGRDALARSTWTVTQPRMLTGRAADDVLFAGDDFTITEADVNQAIETARQRVGDDFADLLENQPLTAEESAALDDKMEGEA